jgi:hypothetical protein
MRARRVDGNHRQIIDDFKQAGAGVLDLHALGGALDVLVGFRGVFTLFEIKDPSQPVSARKTTKAEQRTIDLFRAKGCPVYVIETAEEGLRHIGAIK